MNRALALYEQEVRNSKIMVEATWHGLAVDEALRAEMTAAQRLQRDEALRRLRTLAMDMEFNPASPIQLGKVLYGAGTKGEPSAKPLFPIVKRTKTGKPATDKEALALLALHVETPMQHDALLALVRFRRADRLLAIWLEGLDVRHGTDGVSRWHPSWKVGGTITGRFASSPNAQNMPNSVRKMFVASPGKVLVGIDLSQTEVRGMAYISGDPLLREQLANGLDIHTVNAVLMLRVRPPRGVKLSEEVAGTTIAFLKARLGEEAFDKLPIPPSEDVWKRIRRLAKVVHFAAQYGAVPETIHAAIRAERDPETDRLLFSEIGLAQVEAMVLVWRQQYAGIVSYWVRVEREARAAGRYVCPLSGRIRWFRGGSVPLNEVVNWPIQALIASHMNAKLGPIAARLRAIPSRPKIILQVHDSLVVETVEDDAGAVGDILATELGMPLPPGGPWPAGAMLPPEKSKVGHRLSEVG